MPSLLGLALVAGLGRLALALALLVLLLVRLPRLLLLLLRHLLLLLAILALLLLLLLHLHLPGLGDVLEAGLGHTPHEVQVADEADQQEEDERHSCGADHGRHVLDLIALLYNCTGHFCWKDDLLLDRSQPNDPVSPTDYYRINPLEGRTPGDNESCCQSADYGNLSE